jgi:hypothetical protein
MNERRVVEGITHGVTGYQKHKCRCDVCRAEWSEYDRQHREKQLASGVIRHGITGYKYGCRCDVCSAAKSAYQRKHYDENKAAIAERAREYNAKHPEKHYARRRAWNAANPERIRESNKKWREANPEKVRIYSQRRRALKRGAVSEEVTDFVLWELSDGLCFICDEPVDYRAKFPDPQSATREHVIPLTRGGDDVLSNLALAHYGCNSAKRDKMLEEFWASLPPEKVPAPSAP